MSTLLAASFKLGSVPPLYTVSEQGEAGGEPSYKLSTGSYAEV